MKLIYFLFMAYLVSNIAILATLLALELRVSKKHGWKCRFFQKQFWWMWPATLAFGLPVMVYGVIEELTDEE